MKNQPKASLKVESRIASALPWATNLPNDFYSHRSPLATPHGPTLGFAQGIDVAIRTALSSIITGVSIPAGYQGSKLKQALKLKPMSAAQLALAHDSRQVGYGKLRACATKRPFGVKGGIFQHLSWQSDYDEQVLNTTQYQQQSENTQVAAYYWRHDETPRPTIVFLHGFIASAWHVNSYFMGIERFYRQGYDVVLKILPHHGARTRRSNWMSGLDYVSGGVHHLNHCVAQSTFDIRYLTDYLKQTVRAPRVGLCGMSLGGYTAALMAGLEDRYSFVMPIIPIVSIPDVMMSWRPLDKVIKKIMRDYDVDMSQLREAMASHSPLSLVSKLEPSRLMIIAGHGDRMAPPTHAEALQKHWQGCSLHYFKGSHALPLDMKQTMKAKRKFLASIDF